MTYGIYIPKLCVLNFFSLFRSFSTLVTTPQGIVIEIPTVSLIPILTDPVFIQSSVWIPLGQSFVFSNVEGFPFKKWLLLDTAL